MSVVELRKLPAPERASLVALLERTSAANAHPSLPEPQQLAVTGRAEAPPGERVVLARLRGELVGCAVLSPARDRSTVVHVVVDPSVPASGRELDSALLRRAVEATPPGTPVHLWIMQATGADDARAGSEGFVPERDLLQMRVALPLPDDVVAATRPLPTRSFVPGRDDEAWVETNNRAFAGHPEQGAWTVAIVLSIVLGALASVAVGVVLARYTERPVVVSALRQLAVMVVAAGVTFGVGKAIGTGVG